MYGRGLVKEPLSAILNAPLPGCPFVMDEKHRIVRIKPRATSKSAMFIAVVVALGLQVALCAVLIAIHYQEVWLPQVQNGVFEMELVAPTEELQKLPPEEQTPPAVPLPPLPVMTVMPAIAAQEDLLAMQLPGQEMTVDLEEFVPDHPESDLFPEELANMQIAMKQVKKETRSVQRRPAASLPGQNVQTENETPDKKVRYKYAPSLPNSVNSSKVGKINAVVKVVVGVTMQGEPSSVNVIQSTGNAELDRLFMRWVKENWTFYPAEKDGVPMASKVVVPVRLNID